MDEKLYIAYYMSVNISIIMGNKGSRTHKFGHSFLIPSSLRVVENSDQGKLIKHINIDPENND